MRWQYYGSGVQNEGMYFDLAAIPLEKLHQMQADAEARLTELRASEPPHKRGNTTKHIIWFSSCQDEIKRLHDIRDAIQDHLARRESCSKGAGSPLVP